jgi:hypothetical protein|tara:strand:+ start:105 stop:344 length:240 start_codon:yes stop_codon:yes gene_type:complete
MNFFTYFLIKLIKVYKFLLSPLLGDTCRYFPTCSDYSIESLQKHGLLKGLFLSFKRILSCHPWGKGGFDPVQKEMKVKK